MTPEFEIAIVKEMRNGATKWELFAAIEQAYQKYQTDPQFFIVSSATSDPCANIRVAYI